MQVHELLTCSELFLIMSARRVPPRPHFCVLEASAFDPEALHHHIRIQYVYVCTYVYIYTHMCVYIYTAPCWRIGSVSLWSQSTASSYTYTMCVHVYIYMHAYIRKHIHADIRSLSVRERPDWPHAHALEAYFHLSGLCIYACMRVHVPMELVNVVCMYVCKHVCMYVVCVYESAFDATPFLCD